MRRRLMRLVWRWRLWRCRRLIRGCQRFLAGRWMNVRPFDRALNARAAAHKHILSLLATERRLMVLLQG
ncbi:MAG: hypothetical protein ACE15C_14510 [Phycisphaerae bacterium]